MVDDARAQEWDREARDALARFYGTDQLAGHLAGIVLALLRDRQDLLNHCSRSQGD